MAKLIVDSHIIASFRNRIGLADALSELLDNAFDAGANIVKFVLSRDQITAADNGRGLADMNVISELGASRAASTAISQYGIGAKDAMLYFGSLVTVESVHKGKYRKHSIDWDEVEREGTPIPHSGRALPINRAPPEIMQGGTRITIKRLAAGRPKTFADVLVKRLSHRYRPALRKGKEVEITFQNGEVRRLSAEAELLGLWANEREIMGAAHDRPFTVRYSDLKEYDRELSGLHVGYGYRFITDPPIKKLAGKSLPPTFYAEVMLSSKWRDCLSANKTSLTKYREELEAELYELLKEWIKDLEAFFDEARIEKLNVLLSKHTAQIFAFDPRGSGAGRGKRKPIPEPHDPDPNPNPNPNPDPNSKDREAVDDEGGDGGKKKKASRPPGLRFKRDDKLGKLPFEIVTDLKEDTITILLNGSIPAIDAAYQVPYKIPALWPLISSCFAGWVRDNILSVDEHLPGFLDMLQQSCGYSIDRENPRDVELYVIDWMMRQHPPAIKEMEKAEAAA